MMRKIICLRRLSSRLYSDQQAAGAAAPARVAQEPLVDAFGRRHDYLRISLTERCNLRCQYCMPAEGVSLSARSALVSSAELARLARVFAALGVRRARLTGGEPTLRRDLPALLAELRAAPLAHLAITTNGLLLTRRLPELQRAGLHAVNVSLDSLRADRYEAMARRPGLSRVLAGVDLALQLGYSPVKINTVLMKGFNDDEIYDFAEYTRDRDVQVRFIEFMPFTGNAWDSSKMVPERVVLRALARRYELTPLPRAPHDTARVWQPAGHRGAIGFISSMTNNFCSSCNRLRLTADGNLKVCLFGAAEVSLRDALRAGAGDAELAELVRAALRNKSRAHAGACRGYSSSASAEGAGVGGGAGAAGGAGLSHVDAHGRARMVDVGDKPETARVAVAECRVRLPPRVRAALAAAAALPKGDAVSAAELAGVLAAKRTADLIPLCHPLPLQCVRVAVALPLPVGLREGEGEGEEEAVVRCEVRCRARTGAEMEALTGAAMAALTLYDMCKALDERREMCVTGLRLLHKTGGKSDRPQTHAPPGLAHV